MKALEMLRAYAGNVDWLIEHYEELNERYSEQHIVVSNSAIVISSETHEDMAAQLSLLDKDILKTCLKWHFSSRAQIV